MHNRQQAFSRKAQFCAINIISTIHAHTHALFHCHLVVVAAAAAAAAGGWWVVVVVVVFSRHSRWRELYLDSDTITCRTIYYCWAQQWLMSSVLAYTQTLYIFGRCCVFYYF